LFITACVKNAVPGLSV